MFSPFLPIEVSIRFVLDLQRAYRQAIEEREQLAWLQFHADVCHLSINDERLPDAILQVGAATRVLLKAHPDFLPQSQNPFTRLRALSSSETFLGNFGVMAGRVAGAVHVSRANWQSEEWNHDLAQVLLTQEDFQEVEQFNELDPGKQQLTASSLARQVKAAHEARMNASQQAQMQ